LPLKQHRRVVGFVALIVTFASRPGRWAPAGAAVAGRRSCGFEHDPVRPDCFP